MDALVDMLGDRDAAVRGAVIEAMASHPEGSDPPKVLAEGLKDESAENRAAAIMLLHSFRRGLDPWVPILLRLAEHDSDPLVREWCFKTLRDDVRPPAVSAAVVPVLTASLKSADAKVRSQVVYLLGEFRGDAGEAIPELRRILNEPPAPEVAPFGGLTNEFDPGTAAAWALCRIAPGSPAEEEVIAALIEVARSGSLSRQVWATIAPGRIQTVCRSGRTRSHQGDERQHRCRQIRAREIQPLGTRQNRTWHAIGRPGRAAASACARVQGRGLPSQCHGGAASVRAESHGGHPQNSRTERRSRQGGQGGGSEGPARHRERAVKGRSVTSNEGPCYLLATQTRRSCPGERYSSPRICFDVAAGTGSGRPILARPTEFGLAPA